MKKFWNEYRCDPFEFENFYLKKTELTKKIELYHQGSQSPINNLFHEVHVESEIPSYKSEASVNTSQKEPCTLVSKFGIYQNPTGMHHGKRVWGGGIIKIPQSEWIPWDVDLLDEENFAGETFMGEIPTSKVFEFQPKKKHLPIFTTSVANSGLTSLPRNIQKDPSNYMTMHNSDALPPWISNSEQSKYNEIIESLKVKKKEKNPQRVGAAWAVERTRYLNEQKLLGKNKEKTEINWLPDFGRVFNAGSRTTSRLDMINDSKRFF